MSPERSPEERERARREREARRAARDGRPAPSDGTLPPQTHGDDTPSEPAPQPAPQPPPSEPTLATQPLQPPPTTVRTPVAEPPPPGEPTAAPQRPQPPPPFESPASPQAGPAATGTEARSAAAGRLLARRRASTSGTRKPPKPPGPPDTPGQSLPKNPEPRPRRRLALALAGGLVAIIVAWFLLSLFQPFKGDGEGEVRVAIPKGAGVGEIGDLLEKQGVISSGFFFEARATISGRRDDLKHGTFRLREGMSNGAALDALAEGPPPDVVTITVPEGRSRREVKRIIGSQLRGDYLAATVRSSELNPRSYGAKGAQNLEGFLFPATYELRRGAPVTALTSQQLAAFEREFGRVDLAAAKRKNLTPYDVLTIASMVEREAQIARERPLVASVIYNRLKQGIPLGIDATTRFATNNWTKPLTQSQLALNSPYNTRTHQGLPPGPIGSPGLAAIRAAAAPRRTRFLFYVVKPGTCGEHDFSATDAEFQRDVERYNRERERRGGKSPTNC